MIEARTKAAAISKLEHGWEPQEVAACFDLPLMVVKEWQANLDPKSLIAIESNLHASREVLMKGELVPLQEELVRDKLEKAAIEIASQMYKNAASGDMIMAKSLQLLADGCSKLYAALVLKGRAGQEQAKPMNSVFQDLMRD